MITKQEIMDFSREFSLRPDIIEKDYVLGWLLAGIANNSALIDAWIFKGGTCLKKCYFETYRFSEDLDYTLIDEKHIDEKFLVTNFKKIARWVNSASGIEIPDDSINFEIYKNNSGKISIEGRIGYIGPLQRRNSLARIKLDLTADEILVSESILRDVHHPYSDKPKEAIQAKCYSFHEVFAEKIRALSERARPRDLYDVIHLFRHANQGANANLILEILEKKCQYKEIAVPTIEQIQHHPRIQELESEWMNMLAHQLPLLPARQQFWQELPYLFEWLHRNNNKIINKPVPDLHKNIDYSWKPPSMIKAWNMRTPIELIRYSGANYLCVILTYDNSKKLIEPYEFNRTLEGNLILIAIDHDSGDLLSYQLDKIEKIEISPIMFIPRYLISLTPFLG